METRKRTAVRIRPRPRTARLADETARPRVVVFTSIDGTLLDARTFDAGPSRELVQRLREAGTPVVPVSVMTLDELAPIAADIGLGPAMIIEAGSAIARWSGEAWQVEPCGPPAATLLEVVSDIERRSGANLLVYSALPESDAKRLSGRSGEMLQASTHRSFSEPFVIESGDPDAVSRAAAEIGFSVRRGRRFLHLCRQCDEGEAFTRLRDELQCDIAIAIGSVPVDADFLTRADLSIIVPGPDGEVDSELRSMLPSARIASRPGPVGWAAAVSDAIGGLPTRKRHALGA